MTRRLALLVAVALVVGAESTGPRAQTADPIVVLVSFDGWRSDYIDRANVPNLKALAARGVPDGSPSPRSARLPTTAGPWRFRPTY